MSQCNADRLELDVVRAIWRSSRVSYEHLLSRSVRHGTVVPNLNPDGDELGEGDSGPTPVAVDHRKTTAFTLTRPQCQSLGCHGHKLDVSSNLVETYPIPCLMGIIVCFPEIGHCAIQLIPPDASLAAAWSLAAIITHCGGKHTDAVYVPSQARKTPRLQYCCLLVLLAHSTDPSLLLDALARQIVYYDPYIKLSNASTRPVAKRRSLFRVRAKKVGGLYETIAEEPAGVAT